MSSLKTAPFLTPPQMAGFISIYRYHTGTKLVNTVHINSSSPKIVGIYSSGLQFHPWIDINESFFYFHTFPLHIVQEWIFSVFFRILLKSFFSQCVLH
jgi:hypothetical protein